MSKKTFSVVIGTYNNFDSDKSKPTLNQLQAYLCGSSHYKPKHEFMCELTSPLRAEGVSNKELFYRVNKVDISKVCGKVVVAFDPTEDLSLETRTLIGTFTPYGNYEQEAINILNSNEGYSFSIRSLCSELILDNTTVNRINTIVAIDLTRK